MDWLQSILSKLPLDGISELASQLTIMWSKLVADVPSDMLPIYAYIGFSIIVLLLWLFIVKFLPRPMGGMSWLALFSILFAPGSAAGDSGEIAPASIGVVYGILMKEPAIAVRSLLPILLFFSVGLLLGFIWQTIKKITETNVKQALRKEEAKLQFAAANHADVTGTVIENTKVDNTQTAAISAKTNKKVPTAHSTKATTVTTDVKRDVEGENSAVNDKDD